MELLIVVLVISVLSGVTLGILNSKGVKSKSRDSQRNADLHKIQTALELYYADNRTYPTFPVGPGGGWIKISGSDAITVELSPDYMNIVPQDPINDGDFNICTGPTQYSYNYFAAAGGGTYFLATIMEIESSIEASPCVELLNWSNACSTQDTENVCFGVQNP